MFRCHIFINNIKGHFYGALSLAKSKAQCAVQKYAPPPPPQKKKKKKKRKKKSV